MCTVCVVEVFFSVTNSGLLVPSTRCFSSKPSPLTLKSAAITCVDTPPRITVGSVAVADAEFPPDTVTEFTCGEVASEDTSTVTVIAG
jgi:hypothetical protein